MQPALDLAAKFTELLIQGRLRHNLVEYFFFMDIMPANQSYRPFDWDAKI
jgi:hypothetical protein